MDWNTPVIINEPEDFETPNEESVQFNQEPEPVEKEIDSCSSLLEAMLNKYQFYGQELIATDNFPFGSICFIPFTEFVQWLSQRSTTAMWYSELSFKCK